MNINVFMIGGKRCGKTTILSALDRQTNDAFQGAMSLVNDKQENFNHLYDARMHAEEYFNMQEEEPFPSPDDNPTERECSYDFSLSITGRNSSKLGLSFTDVPGEWFKQDSGHWNDITKHIQASEILIIAIDTPYLMENRDEGGVSYGMYHEEYNRVNDITEYIKNLNVSVLRDRMILFVPVKCEKYYYAGKMSDVANTIRAGYQELFDLLQSPGLRNNCTVAILPILSMGGMEFHRFNELENGYIQQKYRFRPNARYSPKYCEQPVIYTLLFVLEMANKKGVNSGFGTKFMNLFGRKIATPKDFKALSDTLRSIAIINKPDEGFVVVQNNSCIL